MRIVVFLEFMIVSCTALAGPPPELVAARFGRLPLAFEQDGGGFTARGAGYTIRLQDARASISSGAGKNISLEFLSAHPGHASPSGKLPGVINIMRGNDRSQWKLGLPTYERVSWPSLYPSIDLVYYGNQQHVEFDLVV